MTRDYTRYCAIGGDGGGKRGRRGGGRGQSSKVGLWLFTIFLFAAFTLGLAYLGKYSKRHRAPSSYTTTAQHVVTATRVAAPIVEESSVHTEDEAESEQGKKIAVAPPQFEFTTPQALEDAAVQKIVAENKSSKSAGKVSGGVAVSAQADSVPTKQYALEVIKTKSYVAAEKMRAYLALIGIEANVAAIAEQNVHYYKITLGPFDKNTAQAKLRVLKENNIKARLSNL